MDGPFSFDLLAQDVVQSIRTLQLRAVTLVGWSMGACIALKAITMMQTQVKACVFMSANPSLLTRPDYDAGLPPVAVKRLYRRIEQRYPESLAAFYDLLWSPAEKEQAEAAAARGRISHMIDPPQRHAALELLRCLQEEDLRAALDSISQPSLIVHGDNDRICVPEAALFMHRHLPSSRLCMLENTGHVPFVTKKNEVLEALRMFLYEKN
jgi:pimeloyl-[acyl-carrier protein] methyl ester esterase